MGSAVRKAACAILAGGAVLAAALLLGFVGFALSLPREEFSIPVQTEGVVVLTGGSDRVLDAATLLASGRARRMLITGVNPSTRSSLLAKILPVSRELFNCCVDLGYQALDTAGNAKETRDWAREHNITRTLIVVTSNYHMPRALVEISAALPKVELYPFPVVSEHIDVADWISNLRVARFVGKEYMKYVGSLLRTKLFKGYEEPEPPPQLRHSVASD
ncbi:YdcF family protein [Methylocystis sp. FS]|uniref:YdcF family protein n=1 Tax=Methylocystis silviterrae TaxID=2743612 RepID=UPI001583D926|nr:YdcF family protein [Methylocystis silviterrae]NUJ81479.1 YdcF family protein [Methylocystis silviterrae]